MMKNLFLSWQVWALLSAAFAALTAIFAKIGIENVNSDFATFIRTIVILLAAGLMVYVTGNWQSPATITPRTWLFLVLSGLATGASWICYFRALKIGDELGGHIGCWTRGERCHTLGQLEANDLQGRSRTAVERSDLGHPHPRRQPRHESGSPTQAVRWQIDLFRDCPE